MMLTIYALPSPPCSSSSTYKYTEEPFANAGGMPVAPGIATMVKGPRGEEDTATARAAKKLGG